MTRVCVALAMLVALAVVSGEAEAAPAADPLKLNESRGVVIKASPRGGLVVSFHRAAARSFKRLAGKTIAVSCTDLPEPGLGIEVTKTDSETLRAPRRRRPFRVGGDGRSAEFCEITRPVVRRRRTGVSRTEIVIATVPLTRAGAIYLDERARAGELLGLLTAAGTISDRRKVKTYPTTAAVVRESKGRAYGLASPDATPPKGYTGYWSAGGTRAVVAALSAAGRRLYIDVDAEGERISSNVTEYLSDG